MSLKQRFMPVTSQKHFRILKLAETGVLLAVLMTLQAIHLPSFLTGIAVNAVFIFAVLHLSPGCALALGLLNPFGALISGRMLPVLYPMLPVIMCGNAILIAVYSGLKTKHFAARLLIPAFSKALLIWGAGMTVITYFELNAAAKMVAFTVIAIQFFTASAGIFAGEKLNGLVAAEKKN